MGNLSANFSRNEFACKCGCGLNTVDVMLIEALQAASDYFHARTNMHDGCRCQTHNAAVGGEPDSQHMFGKAADIDIEGVAPSHVAEFFDQRYPDSHGIGRYDTFTHIDCRDAKTRWDKRSAAPAQGASNIPTPPQAQPGELQ